MTLVGLIATYRQARAAKNASLDAKAYTHRAIDKLRLRNLTINLSAIAPQIDLVKEHVNSDNLAAARTSFSSCSRIIRDVCYNLEIKFPFGEHDNDDGLDLILKEISSMLDLPSLNANKKATLLQKLRTISEKILSEEAKRRWTDDGV